MCRLLGYCSRGAVPLTRLLGDEEFHDFTALSALHSDGWGMAWYEAGQPHIRKSPGWTPLPNRHVLVTDRNTLRTTVMPLTRQFQS